MKQQARAQIAERILEDFLIAVKQAAHEAEVRRLIDLYPQQIPQTIKQIKKRSSK